MACAGLVFIDDGVMRIYTRNNNRCERQYPELQVLPHYIDAEQAILDGEIVVLDSKGRVALRADSAADSHRRMRTRSRRWGRRIRSHLFVFDLLYLDGYDLRRVPLIERKRLLQKIVKPFPLLRVSDHFENAG